MFPYALIDCVLKRYWGGEGEVSTGVHSNNEIPAVNCAFYGSFSLLSMCLVRVMLYFLLYWHVLFFAVSHDLYESQSCKHE